MDCIAALVKDGPHPVLDKKEIHEPDAKTAAPAPTQETSADRVTKPRSPGANPWSTFLHGDRRVDHYAWLRHKENPEVIAYLKAENAYTDAILKPTEKFQEKLYQEMLGRIQQNGPYRPLHASRLPIFHEDI